MWSREETRTATLAAATPQNFDIECGAQQRLCVIVKNTGGANNVTALSILKSPVGGLYREAASVPSLAPGVSLLIEDENTAYQKLRITLESTTGTTVQIDIRVT